MSRKSTCVFSIMAGLLLAIPAFAQQKDLTYHTVVPCVFIDTRIAGGAFAAGESRSFNVVGNSSFADQGGSAAGCGVPGFSNGIARVQAVAINVVAITPVGVGNLQVAAADQSYAASFLNFLSQNIANTGPVAVAQLSGVKDIKIQANFSGAHVVASVVGYELNARSFALYHMRSYLETLTRASAKPSSSARERPPPPAARRSSTPSLASPTTRPPSPT